MPPTGSEFTMTTKKKAHTSKAAKKKGRHKKASEVPEASNPVLDGIKDEGRCRVFVAGQQCLERHAEGSPFCAGHQAWVEGGRLVATHCPVIHVSTGEQCGGAHRGEQGAGRGYCSKHYQGARRGTPLGTETKRRPVGSGASRIYVSFRFTNAKWMAEELRLKRGEVYECDIYKRLMYLDLIKEGYGPKLAGDESCRQELQRLGMSELLTKSAA
jgi:hypothetical protein